MSGDKWCTSYPDAVSSLLSAWEHIGNDILTVEWDDVYKMAVVQLAGIRCASFVTWDGHVHTVPFPLNWEWA